MKREELVEKLAGMTRIQEAKKSCDMAAQCSTCKECYEVGTNINGTEEFLGSDLSGLYCTRIKNMNPAKIIDILKKQANEKEFEEITSGCQWYRYETKEADCLIGETYDDPDGTWKITGITGDRVDIKNEETGMESIVDVSEALYYLTDKRYF